MLTAVLLYFEPCHDVSLQDSLISDCLNISYSLCLHNKSTYSIHPAFSTSCPQMHNVQYGLKQLPLQMFLLSRCIVILCTLLIVKWLSEPGDFSISQHYFLFSYYVLGNFSAFVHSLLVLSRITFGFSNNFCHKLVLVSSG